MEPLRSRRRRMSLKWTIAFRVKQSSMEPRTQRRAAPRARAPSPWSGRSCGSPPSPRPWHIAAWSSPESPMYSLSCPAVPTGGLESAALSSQHGQTAVASFSLRRRGQLGPKCAGQRPWRRHCMGLGPVSQARPEGGRDLARQKLLVQTENDEGPTTPPQLCQKSGESCGCDSTDQENLLEGEDQIDSEQCKIRCLGTAMQRTRTLAEMRKGRKTCELLATDGSPGSPDLPCVSTSSHATKGHQLGGPGPSPAEAGTSLMTTHRG